MTPLDRILDTLRAHLADKGATEIIEWGDGDEMRRLAEYGRCPCGDIYRDRTAATMVDGELHVASEVACRSCSGRMQHTRDWSSASRH